MGNDGHGRTLDIFDLRDSVIDHYKRFATSFTTINAPDIQEQIKAIYAEQRYWPEPLIQINPSYQRAKDIPSFVDAGELAPECADIFQVNETPITLYKHQAEAIKLAEAGESYIVTTGTGSGKSLCFFIPIVHRILVEKSKGGSGRTRAVIIYPMNALANSQLEELGKFLANVKGTTPITVKRYTGQEDDAERKRIAETPPDILLTNFMMLELLMTRQDETDRQVIQNCEGLRFLVLDELHTYRGRQGADVAMLVRRVRERLKPADNLFQCIGTSATMASEGSLAQKNQVLAEVASKLFSVPISAEHVIVESLERITNSAKNAQDIVAELRQAIEDGIPEAVTDAQLANHPLAIWVETRLGISYAETDQRWVRARPSTITEAVHELSKLSGCDEDHCRTALRRLLLVSSLPERTRTGSTTDSDRSFFAFKLHQFVSGAGHAYATLEPPPLRVVSVDGQHFLPEQPEKRLYAVHFCRGCGHEYHPVRLVDEDGRLMVLPRNIDDAPPRAKDDKPGDDRGEDHEQFGFVTLHASWDKTFTFDDRVEDYPENWQEVDAKKNPRLKAYYRKARLKKIDISPEGFVGKGIRAWFTPGLFRFCLRCGLTQGGPARDRTRLASLSAEGRSSATTVMVASALRWMHGDQSGLQPNERKLLSFTDNRQDAALQAGHFNDFLFVSLVRSGFLSALQAAGDDGLRSDELGAAQQNALGFDQADPKIRAEWLFEPNTRGFNLKDAEATLRQILAFRVWFDQRRGWRYTNPNLEQLGLVRVDYVDLKGLVEDEQLFQNAHPLLKKATPLIRRNLYHALFDHLRKGMAIKSQVLDPIILEQMTSRSHGRIRPPWGFDFDEKPLGARWLMLTTPAKKKYTLRDMDLIVRGGSRSRLGRTLRERDLWVGDDAVRKLKAQEVDGLIGDLLAAAVSYGHIVQENTPFDLPGWRLNDAVVHFRLGAADPTKPTPTENVFFRELYENLAALHHANKQTLFGFEAREHTAQVDALRRNIREKRFRFGDKEQQELEERAQELHGLGEAKRFLPVMFCSPTMELGVDISALNVVSMRNMPPTPANYAQRSGRAGRSGQAALVLTYASSQSPHDQYFFRDPRGMVHGQVKPPLLDLTNRDLLDSHLQALWLSCVDQPLDSSIANLLDLSDPKRPLVNELETGVAWEEVNRRALERIQKVLGYVSKELTPELAPWYTGIDAYSETVVAEALPRFRQSFDRWRDLFLAAEEQRDTARAAIDDYVASHAAKKAAQSRHAQALDQLSLLMHKDTGLTSDFYTYRYLATEGFLPGYNFPRLPLMAYIPGTTDGRSKNTYLQRPRFLALSEFGPRSLVYHEGRAYRVVRALLSLGRRDAVTADAQLPTQSVRICTHCGAGHFDVQVSMCHACDQSLGDADIVNHVYRIENVATYPADRITANDEERQRQGFDMQTTFEWAIRDREPDVRNTTVSDAQGDIARLAYGAGATITRLNKGLRRRANKKEHGFKIDPVSGHWAKNEDETGNDGPHVVPRQWIVPSVQDRKNALLFTPSQTVLAETAIATLQHALLRGIEAVFQLEEGEIMAVPMPTREVRNGFLFYEATEGGAGVLVRLVAEAGLLAQVARSALQVMHFDIPDTGTLPTHPEQLQDQPHTACVAACYRCVMSYYNQPDHERLDRRDHAVQRFLLRTAAGQTSSPQSTASSEDDAALSESDEAWLLELEKRNLPPIDKEPLMLDGVTLPNVWRQHYTAAPRETLPATILEALEDLGFEIVPFGERATWQAAFARLTKLLGRQE